MGLVILSGGTAFYFINKLQGKIVDRYVVGQGLKHIMIMTEGVADIKQVDLQEIFREINILNKLVDHISQNKQLLSEEYKRATLSTELLSSTEVVQNWSPKGGCDGISDYLLFPQEMSEQILKDHYFSAYDELDIWAMLHYYFKGSYSLDINELK